MRILLPALLLFPTLALAEPPLAVPQGMVLLPRDLAQQMRDWIGQNPAVQLYFGLSACISDNPDNGRIVRNGPDLCPGVTQALRLGSATTTAPGAAAAPDVGHKAPR